MQLVSDPKTQNLLIQKELSEQINKVIESGWYILGQEVRDFEAEFAKYCDVEHAVGVANGTDAISIALLALGVGVGDEVICPSFTATFTALAISAIGAIPVFADIKDDYTIDPVSIGEKITSKTKAIVPVHLYGFAANMLAINEIAKKNNLVVVEDACQAHGCIYKGKKVGSWGDAGCFSFYPTKNLGGLGDGGAITFKDAKYSEIATILRNGGQKNRYEHVLLGRNSRLDELQAAILSVKLKYLDGWNQKRRLIAQKYREEFAGMSFVFPPINNAVQPVYHQFVIRVSNREGLMNYLKENEIQTQIHYPIPAHMQPIYFNKNNVLSKTEKFAGEIVSLPIYPELSLEKVIEISAIIKKFQN